MKTTDGHTVSIGSYQRCAFLSLAVLRVGFFRMSTYFDIRLLLIMELLKIRWDARQRIMRSEPMPQAKLWT